ncbi:MAG: DUF695 domain-containing protein [Phycisphaerales bacterium]|nr:DUF695 domain-containing protein [Phycisphaerales bacterium]
MSTEAEWGAFPSVVDDKPAMVVCDISFGRKPDASLNTLIHVRLPLTESDEHGMPTDSALEAMSAAEDAVIPTLEGLGARHVGSIVTGGVRHLYFYSKSDRGIADALRPISGMFPKTPPSAMTRADAKHALYFTQLAPNDWQHQFILNAGVIAELAEAGDDHEAPHNIEHAADFGTRQDRDAFADALNAIEIEFQIDGSSLNTEPDTSTPMPWRILWTHESPIDLEALTDVTSALIELCRQHNGEYDGWGTNLVKT